MKGYDLFDLAARNLRESKLRNGLTTVGIAVGVASLVAMLSLGIGLQHLADSRLAKSGIFDTVFVTSPREFDDHENDNSKKQPEQNRIVDEAARNEIAKLPNVIEVAPEIRVMTDIRYKDKSYPAFMGALPQSAKGGDAFDNMQGTFFTSPTAKEAILQKDFAKTLEPDNPNAMIGKEIVLRYAERRAPEDNANASSSTNDEFSFSVVRKELPLKVVGIIDQEPFGGMRMISRARLFLPTETADSLNMVQFSDVRAAANADTGKGGKTYSMLTVKVSSAGKVEQVQEAIKKLGLHTYSILDATKSLRRFFAIFDMFLGIFGSLALAVASLAIVNTLVMAVLERRREIGVMKALGADDGDVKKLFFTEAGAMGIIGGALGVGLGWLIGRAINFGTTIYLRRQNLPPENVWLVPWWLIGGAIAFAVVVSLIAALYPASRAAKLDPIQALRYE
jgi:putative ABC transport system permease protein